MAADLITLFDYLHQGLDRQNVPMLDIADMVSWDIWLNWGLKAIYESLAFMKPIGPVGAAGDACLAPCRERSFGDF